MGNISEIISNMDNKGKGLEMLIEDLFLDMNFKNVARQKSGSQYGFDVIGYKNGECWKVECKNLSKEATLANISPKLIWHIDSFSVDRFIIVSLNGISNDLRLFLEMKMFSFPIEVWTGTYLESCVSQSPRALKRLGISSDKILEFQSAEPLVFLPNDLKFDIFHSNGLPYSYDYFFINDEQVKAYTEDKFRLYATIDNQTDNSVTIKEVLVRTLRFERLDRKRILRQKKLKGIVVPIKSTFTPKNYAGGEVELFQDNLIEIGPRSKEFIEFSLSKKCESGYYELVFEIHCRENEKEFTLLSSKFPVHKRDVKNDMAILYVVGKYYDTPVKEILELEPNLWSKIKYEYQNHLKYLGPTINDITQSRDIGNSWSINLIKGKIEKNGNQKELSVKSTRESKILVDLQIPIDEPLFSPLDKSP